MELAEVGIIASCALFGLVFLFLVVSGNIKKIHTLEQKVETLEKNLLGLTDDTYSTREKPFKAKHGEKTKEEYEVLANQYKNLEIKYSNLSDNYRLCKDANETLKRNVITARKETAKEILLPIYELCKVRGTITFDDLYFLYKREGVEVEE